MLSQKEISKKMNEILTNCGFNVTETIPTLDKEIHPISFTRTTGNYNYEVDYNYIAKTINFNIFNNSVTSSVSYFNKDNGEQYKSDVRELIFNSSILIQNNTIDLAFKKIDDFSRTYILD